MAPDPSPYRGTPWMFKYSTLRQPRNYSTRVEHSHHMSARLTNSNYTILVDDLVPHNASDGNNPLWCEWGPAPNSAWLIGKDSSVALAQTWFKINEMDQAIHHMLKGPLNTTTSDLLLEPASVA